jgi:CheY-like chemotaxis protein
MNEHGGLLLRQVGIDEASSLDDIFVNEDFPDLDAAIERWIVVHPAGDQRIRWHLRTQSARVKDSRFIAVLRPDDPHYLGLRLVEMLLGTSPGRKPNPLGLSGNVLVIESDSVNRQLALAMMEGADVGCYVVGTIDEAMRILQADQSIPVVVLDEQAVAGGDATLPESIRRIREVAPDSQLVGVGEPEAECRFIKSGIRVFVSRPWTVKRLAAALHG